MKTLTLLGLVLIVCATSAQADGELTWTEHGPGGPCLVICDLYKCKSYGGLVGEIIQSCSYSCSDCNGDTFNYIENHWYNTLTGLDGCWSEIEGQYNGDCQYSNKPGDYNERVAHSSWGAIKQLYK